MRKIITLHVPYAEWYTVVLKNTEFEGEEAWMEVSDGQPAEDTHEDERICLYFKDRIKTVFDPREYAYIESTSNHYSLWHPIDPAKPVLHMYMGAMSDIVATLQVAGMTRFLRVQGSYIVNTSCIMSYHRNRLMLKEQQIVIRVSEDYKEDFHKRLITF